jgi:NADH-quinone oxidoreductase subunit N
MIIQILGNIYYSALIDRGLEVIKKLSYSGVIDYENIRVNIEYFNIKLEQVFFYLSSEFFIIFLILGFIFCYIIQDSNPELNIVVVLKILYLGLFFILMFEFLDIFFQYKCVDLKIQSGDFISVIVFLVVLSFFIIFLFLKFYSLWDSVFGVEIIIFMLIMLLGLLITVKANNFVLLFIGVEVQSLCAYVLAAYKRNSLHNMEAGLKYFLLGAVSSGIFVFGIALLYGYTGSFSYDSLSILSIYNNSIVLLFGFFFVVISLLFKLGAFPYHMWLPDVYAGSSYIVTAVFAVIPKVIILMVIIKLILLLAFDALIHTYWKDIMLFSSIGSLVVGAFGALNQYDIKRFIGYSAITNIGYVLLGLTTSSLMSFRAIFVYIFVYMLHNISLFAILFTLRSKVTYKMVRNLKTLDTIYNVNKILSFMFLVVLFSFIGLPPLSGFFAKFYIFIALMTAKYYFIIVFFLIMNTVGVVYYLAVIKKLFLNNTTSAFLCFIGIDICLARVGVYCILLQIFFVIYDSFILNFIDIYLLRNF